MNGGEPPLPGFVNGGEYHVNVVSGQPPPQGFVNVMHVNVGQPPPAFIPPAATESEIMLDIEHEDLRAREDHYREALLRYQQKHGSRHSRHNCGPY